MTATKTGLSARPFPRYTLIAGFLLLVAHAATLRILGTRPPGPLLSDLMQLAMGACCITAAYQASRRSGRTGRYFWAFAVATFALFVAAQSLASYDDAFHAPQYIQWVENLIFFFWFTPFGVALFLDPEFEPRGFDWLLILDLVQVILFWLAGYFYFFYVPVQATTGVQLTHAVWAPYFIYNGFLLVVFSLRAIFTGSSVVRALFARLLVFLFVATAADFIFYYGPAKNLQTGDWFDFVWLSTNFMFVVGATTWNQREPQRRVGASRVQPHRSLMIQLLPLVYSFLVLLISLQIAVQRMRLAVAIVFLSFVCSGAGLLVTQVRKERSHRLLGVVIEGTQDAIYVKDLDGRYLMINSAGAGLLGREVEEVIGKTDVELLPADIGRLIMERDRPVVQSGRNQTSEEEPENTTGATRTYLTTKGPFHDARGKVAGLFGISHDITERKNMEEDLRVQKVFLEQLIETAPEAIAIVDPDYIVRKINLEFTRVFGFTSEEVCGCNLRALIVPPDKAEESRSLGTFSDKAITSVLETTRQRKDGTRIEVSLLVSPVIVGTDVNAVYCIYRDITERKLANLAIAGWKRRYDDAVLASRQVVFDWDSVSGQVTFGGALEEVLGYSPGVFTSASEKWRELIHPDDLERYVKGILQATETKQAYELEYRVRSSKGEYRMMHEQGRVVLDEGGNVVRIVGFMTDVSERRMLEEQLRQAQKMEAVGRLAGGVAHDFNNLLTVIMGYSQILTQELTPGSIMHDATTQIGSAANRAAGITRQLLAFSRQQVLAPRTIDLNIVILNLDSMLRRLIGEDIEVLTVRARDLGTVKADPGQIEQVIMNLALNARDAMPNGGKLTLETANVELDEAYAREHESVEPGRYVMLAVSDTGVGMSPETQAHIFEPFYTTKETGKGTGLGLSTVYGIVKQSGGHIWVYSELGRGTTLKIYLPRMDQPVEKPGSEKGSSLVQHNIETILLVEDDAQLRQLTSAVLSHCGYRVLAAGSPDEALALCKANHREIELLVTDVVMPGMNGRQLAEQVTLITPQIKVLYISGYTSNAIVHHGVLDAGLWFLAKPFSLAALVAKVREVLDANPESLEGSKSE